MSLNEGQVTKIPLEDRKSTFQEVSQGFTESEALKEAARCLQCKHAPCSKGCPAGIDVRAFIALLRNKDYAGALAKIKESNTLPGVCGRVCPQEEQCQHECVLGKKGNSIQIGYLERFVADWQLAHDKDVKIDRAKSNGIKVAVIGAGPAGLTCAADLVKKGFDVHLFEALHQMGGVLVYGIPEFRLPKHIVAQEVKLIEKMGVTCRRDFIVGRTVTIDGLRSEGFKAFFVSVGAGLPKFLNIPGENLNGVYSANEFLTRVNLMKAYRFPEYDTPVIIGKKVGVFGAGNVALDCARCALRLGAEKVSIIYRRTKEEMPARHEEIENAVEEGIEFNLLTTPKELTGDKDGNITGVRCMKNKLGEPDASGRRSPVEIPDSQFMLDIDTAIIAVGTGANPLLISSLKGVELNKWGYIIVNEDCQSSVADIFAGGDIVSGSATVISAIEAARKAARGIEKYLSRS